MAGNYHCSFIILFLVENGNIHLLIYIHLLPYIFSCSIILEADPSAVVKRVDLRNDDIPIGEQTVAQVTNTLNGLFW